MRAFLHDGMRPRLWIVPNERVSRNGNGCIDSEIGAKTRGGAATGQHY